MSAATLKHTKRMNAARIRHKITGRLTAQQQVQPSEGSNEAEGAHRQSYINDRHCSSLCSAPAVLQDPEQLPVLPRAHSSLWAILEHAPHSKPCQGYVQGLKPRTEGQRGVSFSVLASVRAARGSRAAGAAHGAQPYSEVPVVSHPSLTGPVTHTICT